MRILTYDELTPQMQQDRALLHLSAFGGTWSARVIDLFRGIPEGLADYVGVFAAEGGRLYGQVLVFRIPYAFPEGPGILSGIAAVATHPDRSRSGIARTLLEEVHRRERAAGIERVSLWTNRSWGAHTLYERLGYRDIYSSPWIVRLPGGVRVSDRSPPGVRPARPSDLDEIDRLHDRLVGGRPGFYRRAQGATRREVRAGTLDPGKNLLVLWERGELVGYAHLDRNPYRSICGELIGVSSSVRRALLKEVHRRAGRAPCALQHTWINDPPFAGRWKEPSVSRGGWFVLMGCDLSGPKSATATVRQFGSSDPRFVCLAGDRF
jgi:predicted N-acetyltransferase YhbS